MNLNWYLSAFWSPVASSNLSICLVIFRVIVWVLKDDAEVHRYNWLRHSRLYDLSQHVQMRTQLDRASIMLQAQESINLATSALKLTLQCRRIPHPGTGDSQSTTADRISFAIWALKLKMHWKICLRRCSYRVDDGMGGNTVGKIGWVGVVQLRRWS